MNDDIDEEAVGGVVRQLSADWRRDKLLPVLTHSNKNSIHVWHFGRLAGSLHKTFTMRIDPLTLAFLDSITRFRRRMHRPSLLAVQLQVQVRLLHQSGRV